MKIRVGWDERKDLTSIVNVMDGENNDVEPTIDRAEEIAFGLCGEFTFEQGGRGLMGFPTVVQVVDDNVT